jgi:hypothetical protein
MAERAVPKGIVEGVAQLTTAVPGVTVRATLFVITA